MLLRNNNSKRNKKSLFLKTCGFMGVELIDFCLYSIEVWMGHEASCNIILEDVDCESE